MKLMTTIILITGLSLTLNAQQSIGDKAEQIQEDVSKISKAITKAEPDIAPLAKQAVSAAEAVGKKVKRGAAAVEASDSGLDGNAQLVSSELLKSLGTGAKQVLDSSVSGVNKLTTEAVNLFIFKGLISILYYAVIFIVFYIVKRYIDFLQEAGMDEKKSRALKTSALIITLAFFATQTMPHMMSIAEAVVAPNVFIAKKGAEFYKEMSVGK